MSQNAFACPNCGAPLDYDNSGAATVRCPYCATSVVVPEDLRPEKPPESGPVQYVPPAALYTTASARKQQKSSACLTFLILGIIAFIFAVIGIPIYLDMQASDKAGQVVAAQEHKAATQAAFTRTPTPTITPSPTPTPAFMNPQRKFGQKGIGQGMLDDARNLAIDPQGTLYVADYSGGRVQAFDSTGKYLHQWKVGGAKTIIEGLAADGLGNVYVSFGQGIGKYDGKSGEEKAMLVHPDGGEYGELAVTADNNLLAVWYEGRWGMITSLDGHREYLVTYNPQGKITRTIPGFISNETDELALDNLLAVDGKGDLFVGGRGEVFHFSAAGKYIDRWKMEGGTVYALAVDGQGRVYVGESNNISVFTPDGRIIESFPSSSIRALAFDMQGGLWVLSGDLVTRYTAK